MNVKVHTPSTLKSGSGMSSFKQFFLSLLATTVSIVLTFGAAAVIDYRKNQAAKREMSMMIISDFDNTIALVKKIDTSLRECRRIQHNIACHPEFFDTLQYNIPTQMASWIIDEFPETTEKIFSSNIETFNIIGDVNFVNEVSSFYMKRRKYKELIMTEIKNEVLEEDSFESLDSLLEIDFPQYVFLNMGNLAFFKDSREKCMELMNVSEEDIAAFNRERKIKHDKSRTKAQIDKALEEYMKYEEALEQAREKLKK